MTALLTASQVQRIFEITDALQLHRNWIVVPLVAGDVPQEFVLPDGKILLRPPAGAAFEPWIADLRPRLERLPLSRTPRAHQHDTPPLKIPADAPPGSGPRKTLPWKK